MLPCMLRIVCAACCYVAAAAAEPARSPPQLSCVLKRAPRWVQVLLAAEAALVTTMRAHSSQALVLFLRAFTVYHAGGTSLPKGLSKGLRLHVTPRVKGFPVPHLAAMMQSLSGLKCPLGPSFINAVVASVTAAPELRPQDCAALCCSLASLNTYGVPFQRCALSPLPRMYCTCTCVGRLVSSQTPLPRGATPVFSKPGGVRNVVFSSASAVSSVEKDAEDSMQLCLCRSAAIQGLEALAPVVAAQVPAMDGDALARVASAYCRARVWPSSLFPGLFDRLAQAPAPLRPQLVSTALWALGRAAEEGFDSATALLIAQARL